MLWLMSKHVRCARPHGQDRHLPRTALAPLKFLDSNGEDEEREEARGKLRTIQVVMIV